MCDLGKVCWEMMWALAWNGESRALREPALCGVRSCHGSEAKMGDTILLSMWTLAPRKWVSSTTSS